MKKDLVVLVPDKDIMLTIESLLARSADLEIHEIDFDIFVHPLHDPGVYNNSVEFLREYITDYDFALVFIDREGSGQESKSANSLKNEMKGKIERNGWVKRVDVIVLDPELEIWAWINSSYLANAIGWPDYGSLEKFIINMGFIDQNSIKPRRPKEAFESALRQKRIPRSSSIYADIAKNVNFNSCTEPSFINFKQILINWFSE